jgi:hypothetical protein
MSHIQTFCDAAISKGGGTTSDDSKYFEIMKNSINLVDDQTELLALLEHKNDWVVSWVAAHLLCKSNSRQALLALKNIVKSGGIVGFCSEMVIQEFECGELKSPFGFK